MVDWWGGRDDFSLIAYELGADMARQGIRYRQATVTPYTHLIQDKGLAAEDIIGGLGYQKNTQIPLEINPTSKVCLKVYRSLDQHPIVHLLRMGLCVTVNSDDPPLFNTTLTQEYEQLATVFGLTADGLPHQTAYLSIRSPSSRRAAGNSA